MAGRNAKGQFTKKRTSSAPRSSSSTSIARRPSSSPARRPSSSPYARASRARRSGGGKLPIKQGVTGVGLGVAYVKFKPTIDKLPSIGGTPLVAAAGIAHLARRHVPEGNNIAEGLAYVAGWEVGKNNAAAWGISGNGDDF